MVNLLKAFALLLLVLPALISASCQLSVESSLSETQHRYLVYTATIRNVGDAAASDVLLTPSDDVRKVSGLKECDSGFSLPRSDVKAGGIAAGASASFKYKVQKGTSVTWSAACATGDAAIPTEPATAPTSRPKNPTTAKAGKTTTTTTKKASTTTTTTKKASSPTTTTTKKASTTTTTTKAPAPTTTTTKSNQATTTTTKGSSSGGCGSGIWQPAPLTTWQWQLTGTIDTSFNVQMYDIDLFDNTAATISSLKSKGKVVICYFSTQYENWRPDASSFTSAVLGSNLDDWAGEKYVDIRSTVVRNIMVQRLALAKSKGCDGVEPDNVDGYEASTGFPLTSADQISFNSFIAQQAHAQGLSVGLKNDIDQASQLVQYFDWALNEQCNQYKECDSLNVFINAGKAVFNCEYSGSSSSVCPKMVAAKFSTIFKSLDLDAKISAQCSTAAVAAKCQSKRSLNENMTTEENMTVEIEQGNVAQEQVAQEQLAEAHANSASTAVASVAIVAVVAAMALAL